MVFSTTMKKYLLSCPNKMPGNEWHHVNGQNAFLTCVTCMYMALVTFYTVVPLMF